ncbi:unnamed protein product [Polarella glacialis]|uniref:Uncharacterized protein n=1 Tax=Polarella glacialis TaxID=89957 RepID=A0A813I9T6_POLGL|nr:unnamed protein product [Polarella glacialis]CAE8647903.1 unnamed protein product [Polarella glacialis]CAE8680192.1 unnamed protein product [Polarella glacialis]
MKSSAARQALRVVIHTLGGPREAGWETLAASEYARRLERGNPSVLARTTFHPTSEALEKAALSLSAPVVVLDQLGEQMSTEEFTAFLFGQLLLENPRASFVIGGAEGLPPQLRLDGTCSQMASKFRHISLSRLTFPHRVARVLLLEQLFRARELWAGGSYHQSAPVRDAPG